MPVETLFPVLYSVEAKNYFVSDSGSVWSSKSGEMKMLSTYEDKDGYLRCCLTINNKQHRVPVHRLVATTFHGHKPEGMVCRHLDGNKKNNSSNNLCWGSQAQNIEDQRDHGTMYQGQRHHLAKFSFGQVSEIRRLHSAGMSQKELAEKFGASKFLIHNYVRNKSRRAA